MHIILLGAPGSGKGTQAQFIIDKYNIAYISTGDILRAAVKTGSYLGRKIKKMMDTGKLVTDELVISIVKERINQIDCYNGFLLDGFPRTVLQADALKEAGIKMDYVLEFNVPDNLIIDRIIGRRIHVSSGRIYHIRFNPPKVPGKDDITGEQLSIRRDDQEEILYKRLEEYHHITKPLLAYYRKEAKKNNIKYTKINGTYEISAVRKHLLSILG
ncbi:adenylate kinase [Candidatus Gillettellia adelgis]